MILFIYITHKNICCIAHSILLPKLKRNTSYLLICLQGKGLMHQESNWYFFPWQWFGKGVSGSHRGWILNWNGNSCYYYKVTYVLSIGRCHFLVSSEYFTLSWHRVMWNLFATLAWPFFLVTYISGRCSNARLNFSLLSRVAFFPLPSLFMYPINDYLLCPVCIVTVLWSVCESVRRAGSCSSMQARLLQC